MSGGFHVCSLFVKNGKQREWLEKIGKLADEFAKTAAYYDEHALFPKEHIQQLRDSGYTALTVAERYGGEGISLYDMLLFQERLAKGDGPTALSIGWHLSVMGELAEGNSWDPDVFSMVSKESLKGALVNRAASEAQTGSPTRGGRPGTNAVREGGGWIVNGRKIFTTMSPVLDYFLVTAWIEEKQTIGVFLIHKDAEGLAIEETWDMIAMRGTGSHDLVLTDVRLDDSMLVELLTGKRTENINGWLLHIPAVYLGIAQAARDYAVHFANVYTPNSLKGPIKEVPAVQRHIGEIDLELMKARHFLYHVAEIYDDPKRRSQLTGELGAVKHAVTNAAINVVDKAMRVVGAKSLARTNPLQRYYRDVRAGLHNPPMDDATIAKLAGKAFSET
ncbi:acyl-CoA/acyl-ACP dehydrogenase [Bacillus sonorensis]|uniref:acyl-CoA dehydrogenase family protein n=1 Tax=Bacillus sonorensis TaxID=119858 RepID=UPI001F3139D0|nr:acyl-CoA dehydrogenase family protein [Bacillus sonorensis]MCF7619765.1 acyl-CoA/acyl-ACP dehydrogenase [Bacillus sonorensis]MCY8035343.1 acyl-CoA/acyl-ACP dehydrogenase [Bacillus sonorensis]MCY8087719.1 acyl-CoA/acyl-ACP dehydrogenase [Bacillus sonorensis]MCY8562891.1 acyl-CoA/acyl-ACP dehydrogenase [Bacillus sonorensis]MCZ0070272.1 acyl-CoA/acyl-ACP dehydrogenase [Bacillus sonorensis]